MKSGTHSIFMVPRGSTQRLLWPNTQLVPCIDSIAIQKPPFKSLYRTNVLIGFRDVWYFHNILAHGFAFVQLFFCGHTFEI